MSPLRFLCTWLLLVRAWVLAVPKCEIVAYSGVSFQASIEYGDERNTATMVQVECYDVTDDGIVPLPIYTYQCQQGEHEVWWDNSLGACARCPTAEEVQQALPETETAWRCWNEGGGSCACWKSVEVVEEYSWTDEQGNVHTDTGTSQESRSFITQPISTCSDFGSECMQMQQLIYGWDIWSLQALVTPELECTGLSFSEMPTGTSQIYWLPPVKSDPAYEWFRSMSSYGYEDPDQLRLNWDLVPNRATAMIMSRLEKQGNTKVVGPSLEELQSSCRIKLNAYLTRSGSVEAGGGEFIAGSSIDTKAPPCSVDGIESDLQEWQSFLTELKDVSSSSVSCVNDDGNRRLSAMPRDRRLEAFPGGKPLPKGAKLSKKAQELRERELMHEKTTASVHDFAKELVEKRRQQYSSKPQDQFGLFTTFRQRRLYKLALQAATRRLGQNPTEAESRRLAALDSGTLYEGMPCSEKRYILHKKLETGLERAFMFSTKDSYIGCSNLLNSWTTYEDTEVTESTEACSEPMFSDDGLWNTNWLSDPCCNWAMRVEQCCRPREMSYTRSIISGVNESKIGEYAAILGAEAGQIGLSIALQYASLEREAALKCFPPLKDFWTAVNNTWELVSSCFESIQGSWYDSADQMVGSTCISNADCWTLECAHVTTFTGRQSEKKYCKTPAETSAKDSTGPTLRCLVGSSPSTVGDYFLFSQAKKATQAGLVRATSETRLDFVARFINSQESLMESYCNGHTEAAVYATSREECEKGSACNWASSWKVMDDADCENPCSELGYDCPNFCGKTFQEVGEQSKCRVTEQMDQPSECHELGNDIYADMEQECRNCTHDCQDAETECYSACSTCQTGCDLLPDDEELCSTCTNSACLENLANLVGSTCADCLNTAISSGVDGEAAFKSCSGGDMERRLGWTSRSPVRGSAAFGRHLQGSSDAACSESEQIAIEKCMRGCSGCEDSCTGSGHMCPLYECAVNQTSCSDKCTEDYCTTASSIEGLTCEECYMANCMEQCSDGLDATCAMCLKSTCGCSQSCVTCHSDCTSTAELCVWKNEDSDDDITYAKGGKSECYDNCQEDCDTSNCDSISCAKACWQDVKACSSSYQELAAQKKRQSCLDAACQKKYPVEGTTAKYDQDGSYCYYPELSHGDGSKAACESQCYGDDGPQPQPPSACVAHIKSGVSNAGACYELGDGWIDSHWKDLLSWDWTRGIPPPTWCQVRGFYANSDGQVWVPPPPYGETCLETCEDEYDSCMTEPELCLIYLEDVGFSVSNHCQNNMFAKVEFEFWSCLSDNDWKYDAYESCLVTVGLADNAEWKEYGCSSCWGSWSSYEMKQINCAKSLSEESCQWTGANNESQPCAPECMSGVCEDLKEKCIAAGGSTYECSKQLQALNQCRGCDYVFNWCDWDMCQQSCDLFGSADETTFYCQYCESGSGLSCYPDASCYDDASCWDSSRRMMDAPRRTLKQQVHTKKNARSNDKQSFLTSSRQLFKAKQQLEKLSKQNGTHAAQARVRATEKVDRLTGRLAAIRSRRLNDYPEYVSLDCTDSSSCETSETLCTNFFNRTSASSQAKVDKYVADGSWEKPPWIDDDSVCQEYASEGPVCWIGNEAAKSLLVDNYGWPGWSHCSDYDVENCQDSDCTGCAAGATGSCEFCCECRSGQPGFEAVLYRSSDGLCSALLQFATDLKNNNTNATEAAWYPDFLEMAPQTLGGTGGCKYSLDLVKFAKAGCFDEWNSQLNYCWDSDPMYGLCPGCEPPSMATDDFCIVPGFKAFQQNREYQEGAKNTQETCEAPSCYPDTWVESEEECTSISYCQGECGYCEDESYWGYTNAASRVLCQIRGQAGESLNETECTLACGGSFTDSCYFVKNSVTGTALCVSPTPKDQWDLSNGCREAIIDEELEGATVSKVKYMPLKCSSISRADCGWASETLDVFTCSVQRMQCKTEAECKKAGWCDYQADEWTIQQQGGICARPHADVSVHTESGLIDDRSGSCDDLIMELREVSYTSYTEAACLIYGIQSLTKQQCESSLGGKWFRYAYSQAECEIPGYAWGKAADGSWTSGSHMCCVRWWGNGNSKQCEMFSSKEDSAEACDACGGSWMSMFSYRTYGAWIENKWESSNTWQDRTMTTLNSWVTYVPEWRLTQLWESAVNVMKIRPMSNFVECRMSPSFSSLVGIAKQEMPEPSLGTASFMPGTADSQDFGSVGILTDENTFTSGSDELEIKLKSISAQGSMATDEATNRRLRQRRLALSLTSQLTYHCFSVVTYNSKTVGQLVGDCVTLTLSAPLDNSLELCMAKQSSIPVNPDFTVAGVAGKTISGNVTTFTALALATRLKESGSSICASVSESGTYCPILRYEDYASSSVTSASSGCTAVSDLTKSIVEIADTLVSNGFTGNGDFLISGATTTTLSPEDKVSGADGIGEIGGGAATTTTGTATTTGTTTTTGTDPNVGLGARSVNLLGLPAALLLWVLTVLP